jgi:hypothetical protein
MQMSSQNYFGTNRRTTRGGRNTHMHDLSGGYYYEHPQQYEIKINLYLIYYYFLDVIIIDIVIQLIIINNNIKHVQQIKLQNVVVQQQQQ